MFILLLPRKAVIG